MEVTRKVRGRGGVVYLRYLREEAQEKLVREHGMESDLGSIGHRFLI